MARKIMFSFKKLATSMAVAATVLMTSAINVFADDYQFDLSKASRTFGDGTTYVHYTRLDNEKMDKNNFNPLWMTKDSTMELEFEAAGEYETSPISITFQSWTGEKVTGTEDKIVRIYPSSFTDTTATFTYDDMVQWYGTDDFSDVYCVRVEDNGNQVIATSFIVTNCNIPEDEAENVKGTIIKSEPDVTETEAPVEETSPETETQPNTEENLAPVSDTNDSSSESESSDNTSSNINNTTESTKEDEESSSSTEESSGISPILIIAIAGGVVVIAAVVIIIVVLSKKKKKSKHRFH